MAEASSINFKKSKVHQTFHNTIMRPKYAIEGTLEYDNEPIEALFEKQTIIEKAKKAFKETCKARNKKFQATNYEWSAVINLNETHTMNDVKKVVDYFENEFKFQCYQIAIHRDEGHYDENGNKKLNYHAHLEFITLDKERGQQQFQVKRGFNKDKMREIQTEVAKILKMKRGEDKRISGRKRIEPRVWAAMKEQEKHAVKEKTAELTNEIEIKNYALDEAIKQNKHYQVKRRKTAQTIKKLRAENKEIPKLIKELNEAKKTKMEALKNTGTARKEDYDLIHKEIHAQNEALKETKKKNEARIKELEADKQEQDKTIKEQNAKIKELQNALKTRDEAIEAKDKEIKAKDEELQSLILKAEIEKATKEHFAKQKQEAHLKEIEELKAAHSKEIEALKKAQSSQQEPNAQKAVPHEDSESEKEFDFESMYEIANNNLKNLNNFNQNLQEKRSQSNLSSNSSQQEQNTTRTRKMR